MLHVLLHSRHDLFYPRYFLSQGVIGQPGMLDRLLLKCIHLSDLVFQRSFQELLPLGDSFRDLSHLFNGILDMTPRLLTD